MTGVEPAALPEAAHLPVQEDRVVVAATRYARQAWETVGRVGAIGFVLHALENASRQAIRDARIHGGTPLRLVWIIEFGGLERNKHDCFFHGQATIVGRWHRRLAPGGLADG